MKFNKKLLSIYLSLSIIAITGCSNNKDDNSSDKSVTNDTQVQVDIPTDVISDLSEDLISQIDNFNYKLDQFYSETWLENQFLSKDSYLVNSNLELITIQDVLDYFGENFTEFDELELSDELLDMALHFLIPEDLVPYLGSNISEQDLSILTVYTAIFTDNGVYISSKYDKGGFITNEDYTKIIQDHSWTNGEIDYLTALDDSENQDFKDILSAIVSQNPDLEDLDIKYLARDEKDAVIVVGSTLYSNDIRQFALSKNSDSGEWEILIDQLENLDSNIYINYQNTSFNLDLLPKYDLKNSEITSHTILIDQLMMTGNLPSDTVTVYSCTAGNFGYYIFENNDILLTHINSDGVVDIYTLNNYQEALEYMLELEEDAPTFIIKYN